MCDRIPNVQSDPTETTRQLVHSAEWAHMSNIQRAQWCLRSTRLKDTEQFRRDFGSLNGPDPNMSHPTHAPNVAKDN